MDSMRYNQKKDEATEMPQRMKGTKKKEKKAREQRRGKEERDHWIQPKKR